jgi:hypothetical protein
VDRAGSPRRPPCGDHGAAACETWRVYAWGQPSEASVRVGRAPARPGVEIRPAPGTQSGAILAAEGIRGHGEREFLAHRRTDVHVGYLRRKRVHGGIIRRFRISAEEHLDVRVEERNHICEASATGPPEPSGHPRLPEVFSFARLRQASLNLHRSIEIEPKPREGRILRLELPDRLDRSPVKVPDVDLKHSPKS